MRKELYESLVVRLLSGLKYVDGAMTVLKTPESIAEHSSAESVVKHVDLWNHNVEFIEEDSAWSRPAVFVEFAPIVWSAVQGRVEYTTRARVLLHVVTDWCGSASAGSEFQAESLGVFDLLDALHELLEDFGGESFDHLKLVESRTNHNHEDIVENVEVFEYRGRKLLG